MEGMDLYIYQNTKSLVNIRTALRLMYKFINIDAHRITSRKNNRQLRGVHSTEKYFCVNRGLKWKQKQDFSCKTIKMRSVLIK